MSINIRFILFGTRLATSRTLTGFTADTRNLLLQLPLLSVSSLYQSHGQVQATGLEPPSPLTPRRGSQRSRHVRTSLYTTTEVSAPIGGVCFSLPTPSCREAARGELRSGGGQAKAYPTSDEALTQQLSASCITKRSMALYSLAFFSGLTRPILLPLRGVASFAPGWRRLSPTR